MIPPDELKRGKELAENSPSKEWRRCRYVSTIVEQLGKCDGNPVAQTSDYRDADFIAHHNPAFVLKLYALIEAMEADLALAHKYIAELSDKLTTNGIR